MTTTRADLAAAVRAVNAAYNRLPVDRRDRVDLSTCWVDREVDDAIRSGDEDRATAAIRTWRRHWLDLIDEAAR